MTEEIKTLILAEKTEQARALAEALSHSSYREKEKNLGKGKTQKWFETDNKIIITPARGHLLDLKIRGIRTIFFLNTTSGRRTLSAKLFVGSTSLYLMKLNHSPWYFFTILTTFPTSGSLQSRSTKSRNLPSQYLALNSLTSGGPRSLVLASEYSSFQTLVEGFALHPLQV
ncbi:hypothetical protein AKJ64_01390 [candidate division MSBL1 archaeon SCGC-AAA259E17]|uniref:Uncharacterized protein n=1 Tax=candidate division MSBL1 archaeon SCGC-AAA259E17 TaxID=1698263 RepID=A0A133UFX4_9EURY|nr:hypothetical protein AKJ64_01390 [candidate division MSBL1 archaeon SCGC-AAA259E17]